MAFPIGGIDISSLSDDDLLQLTGAAQEQAPPQPQAAAGGIDIKSLSDKDLAAISQQVSSANVPGTEAAARLFYKHLTFGTQPGVSEEGRKRAEAAASEHPYLNLGAGAGAMAAQMAALGPAAAALRGVQVAANAPRALQAAGALARGTGGALEATMLPNTQARTALGAMATGAKVGGIYSGAEAAGEGLTEPNKSLGDTARDVAISTGLGTVGGGILGGAGHGASRLLGAGINRIAPELADVRAAARAPEAQGARDIERAARLDGYTPEDLARLRANLADPAQAHRYEGLNLIEALETTKLQPMPGTGELKPGVKVSPNLRDAAQDFAQTEGRGRQIASEAYHARKNETSAKLQGDIDVASTGGTAGAMRRQFGQAAEAPQQGDALPAIIDQHFGSGDSEAAAKALADRKATLGKRYDRLRAKPLLETGDDLQDVAQKIPEFKKALDYAAKNDIVRMNEPRASDKRAPATRLANPDAPPVYEKLWSEGKLGDTIVTLSPNNVLDIHHALVMSAKPPITGATPESMMAGKLKNWFSNWVDKQFKGHKDLRTDYANFKRTMEAQDLAPSLPLAGGDINHPALKFLAQVNGDIAKYAKVIRAYDAALAKFQAGQNKNPPKPTMLNKLIADVEAKQDVLDTFRRSWAENWKQEIGSSRNPALIVKQALTPEGRRRLTLILGPEKAPAFIDKLLAMEAREQGKSLGLVAGGSDHQALRFFEAASRDGRAEVVAEFRNAWAQRLKDELARNPETTQFLRQALTQEGKDRILRVFGQEDGTALIESLYNKAMQNAFSKTLYGGPDTAYKLARNRKKDALMDAVHGVAHLRPMQTVKALGELGSARYKEQRADQANELLSKQGPEDVGKILDAILARTTLATTGHPYVRNPLLRALGPVGTEAQVLYENR